MSKEDRIKWIVASVVFVLAFVVYFVYGFFHNCVFHWPIRRDVSTCWHEQIAPAQHKAAESASQFAP